MRWRSLAIALALSIWSGSALAQEAGNAVSGVVAPAPLETPAVPYPDGAVGDAVVVLELEIAEDGTVARAQAREGVAPFAQAAELGVMAWRFAPALKAGIPVRVRVLARVEFHQPETRAPILTEPAPFEPAPASEPPSTEALEAPLPEEPIDVTVVGTEREELGSIHIPRHETRQIPGAFADPFRVVEILPGVAPVLSGLPYFFVRGAPPGNVGYFVDGIRVPILFHVGAGPSVIAPALVERVDLFASAYPAAFGRAVGGVMAGETTAPRETGRAEAQARVFDAGGMVEQPFADGRGSALVGARYSYTQALLSLVAPDYELGYGDYQARLAYAVSERDRLSAFAFGGYDELRNGAVGQTLFDVAFHRLDLRWDRVIEGGDLRVAGTLSSDSVLNAEEGDQRSARIASQGARLRFSVSQRVSPEVAVRAGGDLGADRMGEERELRDPVIVIFPERTDLGGGLYGDAIFRPNERVEIVPGVRLDLSRVRGEEYFFAEPRLATRIAATNGLAWIAAFGLAHQLPTSTVHVPGAGPSLLELTVQESWQASQGLEFVLPSSMLGRVTAFHSWAQSLDDEVQVKARNYGVELFLRRDFTERLGGFLSYTLSRAERDLRSETVASSFDRRHVLSAVLGYDLGRGFRAGARGYLASGRPYRVDCPTPDCGPGDPTAPREYVVEGRVPHFFRLDVRLEKRWRFRSGAWVAATFEWFNALLAEETIGRYWDPVGGGIASDVQSPLTLPSIGIEAGY